MCRGQELTFMIDSGASCNFISKIKFQTLGFTRMNMQKCSVRLANGKMLNTCGRVHMMVNLGGYRYLDWFHVLDCDVPLILGMTFLAKVSPKLDFVAKTVSVKRGNKWIMLPSVQIVNGKVLVASRNKFEDLQVEPSVDSNEDSLVDHCDDNEKIACNTRVRSVRPKCKSCGKMLCKSDTSRVCKRCSNHSFGNLKSQFNDKSRHSVTNVEVVPLSQFRLDYRRKQYLHCGLINVWQQ